MNKIDRSATLVPAVGAQVERVVGRPVPKRDADGMPASRDERYLRRLLARHAAMPHTYYDDGEAQGQEHGIVIDFMREPVDDIDAKLRALSVARMECSKPALTDDQAAALRMVLHHYGNDPRVLPLAALLDAARSKTPNML